MTVTPRTGGHFGREKGARAVVTRWPAAGAAGLGLGGATFQSEWLSEVFAFSAR